MPDEITQTAPPAPDPNAPPAPPQQEHQFDRPDDRELDSSLGKLFEKEGAEIDEPVTGKPAKPDEGEPDPKPDPANPPAPAKAGELPHPDTIKAPEKLGEKNVGGWKALKANYAKAHEAIAKKDKEIGDLKKALAERGQLSQKELDDLKKQNDELSGYRAMVDIQADPEFIKNFEEPAAKMRGSIESMLKDVGVSEAIVKQLDFTDSKLMDEVVASVEEKVDKIAAKRLMRRVEELIELDDKREEFLADHKGKHKEFFETKKKESFAKQAESQGKIAAHLERVREAKDEKGEVRFPFLSKLEPKEGASQAEVAQAQKHNQVVEAFSARLDGMLKDETPESRAEMAVAALSAHWVMAMLKAEQRQTAALRAELQKISKTTEEPDGTSKRRVAPKNGSLDLEDSMQAHFGRTL